MPDSAIVVNTMSFDQTEETHLVDKGHLQLETGFLYNNFDTGHSAWISRTLIRYFAIVKVIVFEVPAVPLALSEE